MEQSELIKALERVCGRIRELESSAYDLHERGDSGAATGLLREKAELLADLPRIAAPHLGELPETDRTAVADRIEKFAAAARRSLDIGSIFYMTNLLYDADHAPGALNNLELLNRDVEEIFTNSISADSD